MMVRDVLLGRGTVPLKRRAIPFVAAVAVASTIPAPPLVNWVGDQRANLWSALVLTVGFAFLAMLFGVMRDQMTDDRGPLTVFGTALIDFFSALVVLFAVLSGTFGLVFVFGVRGTVELPIWFRLASRAGIAGGVVLTIGTGIAMLWEMAQVRDHIIVHVRDEREGDR